MVNFGYAVEESVIPFSVSYLRLRTYVTETKRKDNAIFRHGFFVLRKMKQDARKTRRARLSEGRCT